MSEKPGRVARVSEVVIVLIIAAIVGMGIGLLGGLIIGLVTGVYDLPSFAFLGSFLMVILMLIFGIRDFILERRR